MSRVDVVLHVPLAPDANAEIHEVMVEGAVVRIEAYADEADSTEVAVFFTGLEERDRIAVEAFVRAHVEGSEII